MPILKRNSKRRKNKRQRRRKKGIHQTAQDNRGRVLHILFRQRHSNHQRTSPVDVLVKIAPNRLAKATNNDRAGQEQNDHPGRSHPTPPALACLGLRRKGSAIDGWVGENGMGDLRVVVCATTCDSPRAKSGGADQCITRMAPQAPLVGAVRGTTHERESAWASGRRRTKTLQSTWVGGHPRNIPLLWMMSMLLAYFPASSFGIIPVS